MFTTTGPWLRRWGDVPVISVIFVIGVVAWTPPGVLMLHRSPDFTNWFDQGQYLKSARAFTRGNLDAAQHWYPFLYPLLLSGFAWLPSLFQAFVPDMACYVLTYLAFRSFARSFGIGNTTAAALFFLSTMTYFELADAWIQPWTTTLSACLIWTSLAISRSLIARDGTGTTTVGRYVVLGVVLAAIPFSRPADAVVPLIETICLIGMTVARRRPWRGPVFMVLAAVIVAALLSTIYVSIYGFALSPYLRLSAAYGAALPDLGWKAYIILIEPRPWYPYGSGILKLFPWLIVGAAGLIVNLVSGPARSGAAIVSIVLCAYLTITLCYLDLLPSGLWKFGNFHYFKWTIPAFALFGYVFVRDLKRDVRLPGLILLALLTASAVRYTPVLVGASEPARAITFPAVAAPFADVYFARSVIRDSRGSLRNRFDYHQVPSDNGPIVAEALRRDFAGNERWIDPGISARWPRFPLDSGPIADLPGSFPKLPLRRYRPEMSFGWPCWLPPYECPHRLP